MDLLITSIGSGGDVHPSIAIAIAAARQRHTVRLAINPAFAPRARSAANRLGIDPARLDILPIGTEHDYAAIEADPRIAHPTRSTSLIITHLMARAVEPTVHALRNAIAQRRPDLILRHHASIGSRWVAHEHRIPCATSVLAPMFFFSRQEPIVFKNWPFEAAPPWLREARFRLGRLAMRLAFDRPINRLRATLGFPKDTDLFFDEILGSDLTLGLWSPAFRPPMPDDHPSTRIVGFCPFDHHQDHHDIPRPVAQLLDATTPPLIFTLGTIVAQHGKRFYHAATQAARLADRPAILLCPRADQLPTSLPPGVAAAPYLPYSAVLPRAAALVHHGGIGTTAQALAAGLPTVVVPHIADQYDHAARARRLGCSATVPLARLSARALADAIDRVLTPEPIARARALAQRLRFEDGPANTVRELEHAAHLTP